MYACMGVKEMSTDNTPLAVDTPLFLKRVSYHMMLLLTLRFNDLFNNWGKIKPYCVDIQKTITKPMKNPNLD